MSDSFKRTLTERDQITSTQSETLGRTDTSPELTAQLRNVGSRIRKSVTEGYITPPTSRAFTKAQSTTTVFSSAKDINRDVFGSPSRRPPVRNNPAHPHNKRSRSADRGSDTEPGEVQDEEVVSNDQAPANAPDPQRLENRPDRIIKPLRKHRGLMETRSLPVGAFRFSNQPPNPITTMAPTIEAEEDWSIQSSNTPDQSMFEPVVFD
ncbi:hypothetical protein P691DRAFT_772884 [Macrolepiota fuliginosa MF-IS2]|uniref:Uncharacterized protein n=1 Tax=Macrolepiota fuliginosa MF-IS2 TaxID=1400762 RepID=A0A9P5XHV6_9AGAR|nr:hypothetical protein P691DRAFT_772884 [Macrolepiota fuliginosa MF-IS2]